MKNIKKIFFSDLNALIRHPYVLVIALGLCCLPALYAWFNIYSNWDPYGSTGNIKIAVASMDTGYTDAAGTKTNVGDSVIETLKKNTSINWVFVSAEQAKEGVYSGDYYAAIILPEDFSSCMFHGILQGLEHPEIIYYENEKKNAVATKITDSAVTSLQNNINKMYISILVSNVFEKGNTAIVEKESDETIAALQKKIMDITDNLDGYSATVASLVSANEKLSVSIDKAKTNLNDIQKKLKKQDFSEKKQNSRPSLLSNLLPKSKRISSALSSAALQTSRVKAAATSSAKAALYQKAISQLDNAKSRLENLIDVFSALPEDSRLQGTKQQLLTQLEKQAAKVDSAKKLLQQGITAVQGTSSKKDEILKAAETKYANTVSSLRDTFDNTIAPLAEEAAQLSDAIQNDIASALQNITKDISLLKQVFTGAGSGLSSANESLSSLSEILRQASADLAKVRDAVGSVSESEWLTQALAFMQGNPEGYGDFFAAPIKTETTRVYPVKNYGSGVTPFYTTLAIWVGGIFLVSMIKVNPAHKKYPDAKPHELFLGRFLLFFVLGQIQTLIIVVVNLSLLHVQCLYPKHFWFASAAASLTFMLLIYAFTVSFGDVGKALIVVFIVIQIAGSSGTFPIEILPEFYQKMYIFFPFPYAIDAMREAICGLNGSDYYIYLLQLSLFAVAALLLGLVIRLPFRRITEFVERRMEDTELM